MTFDRSLGGSDGPCGTTILEPGTGSFSSASGGPVLHDGVAGIFDRVTQGPRGVTENGIAILVEDHNFIVAKKDLFSALMIEQDHIVGLVAPVIGNYTRAPLGERLDNFRRLRPSAAPCRPAEPVTGAANSTANLPGLAVADEDPRPT